MRVAFYGNTANNFTEVVSALRAFTDIEAFLLLDEATTIYTDPSSYFEDGSYSEPAWIVRGKWLESVFFRRSPVVSWLEQHDVDMFVCSDMGARVIPYVDCVTAFAPIGFDLILFPIKPFGAEHRREVIQALGQIVKLHPAKALKSLGWSRLRTAQYRGVRAADHHLIIEHPPFVDACDRLGLREVCRGRILIGRSWIPVHTDLFRSRSTHEMAHTANALRETFDFIVFHPTRMHITDSESERKTGPWKGNDTLIAGYRLFLDRLSDEERQRVCLVMPDRPAENSRDIDVAKALIRDLDLQDHVAWLSPASDASGFTRSQMVDFYSACDVVADHFAQPGVSSSGLEALSVGRPLLLRIDLEVELKNYGDPFPAFDARTPEDVSETLTRLYRDPDFRADLGRRARDWTQRFHSREAAALYWRDLLVELSAGTRGHEVSSPTD